MATLSSQGTATPMALLSGGVLRFGSPVQQNMRRDLVVSKLYAYSLTVRRENDHYRCQLQDFLDDHMQISL